MEGAGIAAAQGDGDVESVWRKIGDRFGLVSGEVVAQFLHGGDGFGIDSAAGMGARAVGFNEVCTVHSGEGLGHLAAVAVFDAEEEDAGEGHCGTRRRIEPPRRQGRRGVTDNLIGALGGRG